MFENLEYPNLELVRPVILAGGEGSKTNYSASFDRFMDSTLIETIYTLMKFSFQKDPLIICKDKEKFEELKEYMSIEASIEYVKSKVKEIENIKVAQ